MRVIVRETATDLPAAGQMLGGGPREGDIAFVLDTNVQYFWDGTQWLSTPSSLPFTPVTADYVVQPADSVVLCDCSGGAITVTLPASTPGRKITIIKVDETLFPVTIEAQFGEEISHESTQTLGVGEAFQLFGDGSDWWVH